MHKTGCVPLFFLLDDEHGVVIRRIVKHELEWRPPATMAIESLLCRKMSSSGKRRKNSRKEVLSIKNYIVFSLIYLVFFRCFYAHPLIITAFGNSPSIFGSGTEPTHVRTTDGSTDGS